MWRFRARMVCLFAGRYEASGGFRSKFDPLKPQAIAPGEVWAYPLLLWKRYDDGIAPISPMLAVNAVHAADEVAAASTT